MTGWPRRRVFSLEVLQARAGFVLLRVSGKNTSILSHESGGHRWQRVPPTEKRGRRQTSTITVAVLEESSERELNLNESDLEETVARGSGPGGQARNRTESCVQIKHKPTGIVVRIDGERSQHQNRATARLVLATKLQALEQERQRDLRNSTRKQQIGSGMRGDKIRTIQEQNGVVINHLNNKKILYKNYVRGNWDGLL